MDSSEHHESHEFFKDDFLFGQKIGLPSDVSNHPLFAEALNELSLGSVDSLSSALEHLHLSRKQVDSQLEDLIAENYGVILDRADTCSSVLENLSRIVSTNADLIARLPALSNSSQALLSKSHALTDSIKQSTKALEHHTQLLELLELPQLMETSIHNEHFDDAISILNYTRKLYKNHGLSIPIIQTIHSQVNTVGCQLINQLCNKLRSPLSLPACIKIVVLLRRTGVFTEQELRLKFLQTRNTCLENQLHLSLVSPKVSETIHSISSNSPDSNLSSSFSGGFRKSNQPHYDAYWRATRRTEVTRVQLFDIVTQYRAVFFDHNSPTLKSDLETADVKLTPFLVNPLCLLDESQGDSSCAGFHLFNAWLLHRVTTFLNTLTSDVKDMLQQPSHTAQEIVDRWSIGNFKLPGPNGSSHLELDTIFTQLQSLISQTMYFGRSLGRFGCDFRPHLTDLFLTCISDFVNLYLQNASDEFTIAIGNLPWKIDNEPLDGDTTCADPNQHSSSEETPTFPPALVSSPPLALLYNRFVALFNGLRFCCPVALKFSLIKSTSDCLTSCSDRILTAYHSLLERKTIAWRSEAADFATNFANELVPNILSHLIIRLLSTDTVSEERNNKISHIVIQRLSRTICTRMHKTWPRILSLSVDLALPLDTANPLGLEKLSESSTLQTTLSDDEATSVVALSNTCPTKTDCTTDTVL